jgi:CRP/FNR family transcriptional regulator, cyclic AMP receptor protein
MGTHCVLELTGNCESCPLKREGFFCTLPQPALKAFDAIKLTIRYRQDAILFIEKEPPRGVFVLCRGRIKLSVTSSDGKGVILRIVNPGEVLGLHAVVSGEGYEASAQALEPCTVNFIGRNEFMHFLQRNPDALLRTAEQLSHSYQIACEQVRSLALGHSATEKLAAFLLAWAARGEPIEDGTRVLLTLTHEEIGQMIGLSRETVTRAMGDFKRRKIVATKGATLMLRNKDALEQCAGL